MFMIILMKMILILLAQHIELDERKALKKKISEELMPMAWHPKRCWNFCIPEDEKKEIETILTK